MKKIRYFFIGIAVLISLNLVAQNDVEGTKDNSYLTRFNGSWITWQQTKNFDRYFILSLKDNKISSYEIDGKVVRTQYNTSEEHSVFEIFKSYELALKKDGYEMLITLDEKNCAVNLQEQLYNREFSGLNSLPREASKPDYQNEFTYFAAKKKINDKDVYIVGFIVAWGKPLITLDVIEVQSLEDGLVTAKKINETINNNGHIAIYNIFFDSGKSSIKTNSEDALKNISEFLNSHRDKKFIIVGHTDNTGSFDNNVTLSKERAESVKNELVAKYSVNAEQIKTFGDGSTAPISSNSTEEGKAKNRRVEIVEQ